jgi:hypothetical protein
MNPILSAIYDRRDVPNKPLCMIEKTDNVFFIEADSLVGLRGY